MILLDIAKSQCFCLFAIYFYPCFIFYGSVAANLVTKNFLFETVAGRARLVTLESRYQDHFT